MRSACPHSGWPSRPRPSVAAETNPARLSLVELDVGDLLRGHQDSAAALIGDHEELVVRERGGEGLLDLLHRRFGLDDELARSHLYTDLDFHRDPPLSTYSWVGYSWVPSASGQPLMPRQASRASSSSARR